MKRRFSGTLLVCVLAAVTAVLSDAAAEMQIRLRDGRVLTVPVERDQVEAIEFGDRAPGSDNRTPAERAAGQLREDAARVRSAGDAASRAAAAAEKAETAAAAASRAADEAKKAREEAARAAQSAGQAARQAPPAAEPPRAAPAPAGPAAQQSVRGDGAGAPPPGGGRVLTVGPDGAFKLPSAAARAARDGDVVEIASGSYVGDVAVWRANNLVLRGVGGRVQLEAAGKAAEGKAIWVIKGNNNTVQNIEFAGCRVPDLNGAGIRLEGAGLTVRHSYFFDNEIGIMTGANPASDVLIEHSEFARNRIDYDRYAREGRNVPTGINPGHNIYIGEIRSFTLRFSYIHHASYGHNVKSRARRNVIAYNRIGDEKDGNSSYLVDLSTGGWALLLGNVLQQGVHTDNWTMVSHGAERRGSSEPLYVINNTFVNERGSGIFVQRAGQGRTVMINNILAGGGTPVQGGGELRANLIVGAKGGIRAALKGMFDSGAVQKGTGALAGNLIAGDAGFVNPDAYDYRLRPGSPAIDAGEQLGKIDGEVMTVAAQYRHPLMNEPRRRNAAVDIGAFEFTD